MACSLTSGEVCKFRAGDFGIFGLESFVMEEFNLVDIFV